MWINDVHCRQAAEMLGSLLAELPGLDPDTLGPDAQVSLKNYQLPEHAVLSPGQQRVLDAFSALSPDAFGEVFAAYRQEMRRH